MCAAEAVMKASGGGFSDIFGKPLEYPMEYDRCAEMMRTRSSGCDGPDPPLCRLLTVVPSLLSLLVVVTFDVPDPA